MDGLFQFLKRHEKYAKNVDLLVALAIVGIVIVMIIPLPSFMMDIALTLSISSALLILLVAIYTEKALDFGIIRKKSKIARRNKPKTNIISDKQNKPQIHKQTKENAK